MNDLETIEHYFAGQLSDAEKARFEQQIVADPELAEAVAFYLQARKTAQETALRERKAEWDMIRQQERKNRTVTWRVFAYAAAACALLVLGLVLFRPQTSPEEMADQYIREQLTTLSVTMGSQPDSLQRARQAYNEGNLTEAETRVSALRTRDPNNTELIKLAGLVALRRGNYDQAIERFQQLGQRTDLRANPGFFYEALTLLKRNQPGDKNRAQELLQTVIDQNLEGKKAAEGLILTLK